MTTVRIASVETTCVEVPLARPTGLSTRTVPVRVYALVRVTGDDGVSGLGFCYVGHRAGEIATLAVERLLAPVVVGGDALAVERHWQAMYQEALLHGRAGSVMRALSAIDIALWDRNARAAGQPLWRWLGGPVDEVANGRVPAYASGGYYWDGEGPAELADEMRGYVAAGFTAVKLKIGRLSPHDDEARLTAVREAVGPDVLVMLDANNAFADVVTAARAARLWQRHDPYWLEEPFSPDDIGSHAALASQIATPVATGEIEAGRWRHQELLDAGGAAILQTDAAVCGGITEFRRIAGLAAARGVPIAPHWFHDLHAHLVAATPNAQFVEYFPDSDVLNFRELITDQLEVDAGRLVLPERPGLGFEFNPVAVERHQTQEWRLVRRQGC